MKQYVQDRIIAAAGLVLVVLGLWICSRYPAESAFFPRTCLVAIGILLALLAIESAITKRKLDSSGDSPQTAVKMKWEPFLLVTCTLGIYVISVKYIGFYTASAVFLAIVGFLWGGVKKTTVLLFSACLLIFLYVCFTVLFNVPLPTGLGR